jgi:hypothetical protein
MTSISGTGACVDVAVGGGGGGVEYGDAEGYTVPWRSTAVGNGVADTAFSIEAVGEADGATAACTGVIVADGVISVRTEAAVGENAARAVAASRGVCVGDGASPHPTRVTATRSPQSATTILRLDIGILS